MLRSPSVLAPFIIFAAIQFLVLVCLGAFSVPPISTVMVPVVERLGGEEALHYPMHLVLLPRMYHLVYIPLAVFVGFVLFGWSIALMIDHLERSGIKVSRVKQPHILALAPSMMAVGFVFVAVLAGIEYFMSFVSGAVGNPKLGQMVSLVHLAVVVVFQALTIYSLYYIVTRTRNPVTAILSSIRFGRSNLIMSGMLIVTVLAIHYPVDYLTRQSDRVVLKFNPELVFLLLALGIVLEVVSNFFLFASTTSVAAGVKREGI
ncbi:MAG: hypothetical protein PVF33_04030 [Candidatus Latescibacterota bacterium]|jgi:hypothetical protein